MSRDKFSNPARVAAFTLAMFNIFSILSSIALKELVLLIIAVYINFIAASFVIGYWTVYKKLP